MRGLIIVGASGHGKVCADMAERQGYGSIRFLDDRREVLQCRGCEVAGVTDDYKAYVEGWDFFVAIGEGCVRRRIMERIEGGGGRLATLIHPDAVLGRDVVIGRGSAIMAGTVINSGTSLGKGVIINTSSSVDHDCMVGDYSHISVGSHLCGNVEVGEGTWIGAGAVVRNHVRICGGCVIGVGAAVVRDIWEAGTYVGVPARVM